MLRVALTLAGHDVYEAADGPTGIDLARTHAAEVALIDVGLPGLVGYEVARRIRASQGSHAMRLIAITGYGQAEDRHRARDAGFDAHLTTPVSPERLAAAALSPGPGTTTRSADPNQRPCHASWVYPPTFWDLRCSTDATTSCNRGADDRRPLAGGLAIPSPAHVAVSSTTPASVARSDVGPLSAGNTRRARRAAIWLVTSGCRGRSRATREWRAPAQIARARRCATPPAEPRTSSIARCVPRTRRSSPSRCFPVSDAGRRASGSYLPGTKVADAPEH